MRSVYFGWWIAAAGALLNALSSGIFTTGASVFFLPLSRDMGLSRTATSVIFGFARLEGGLQGLLTGYCIDRWGPRIMMVIGAVLAGVGFMVLPATRSFIPFLLVWVGIISLGIHTGYNQGVMAAVNRWFVRKRGTAFGLVLVGIALGGAVITPILSLLVLDLGWRKAAFISGLVMLVVGVPLSLFMRNSPEEMGQLPDGDTPSGTAAKARPTRFVPVEGVDYTAGQAFRTVSYWVLAVGICFRIAAHVGAYTHMVPLMVWKGLSEQSGALMIGVISFSAMGTRVLMGWWSDRWSKQKVTAVSMLTGTGSFAFLLFSGGAMWQLVVFGVLFSVTEGCAGPTWALIGDFFGRRAFATLRGGINLVAGIGALAATTLSGRIFDVSGSYSWATVLIGGLFLAAAIVFLVLRRPRVQG